MSYIVRGKVIATYLKVMSYSSVVELAAHNGLVAGSIPAATTTISRGFAGGMGDDGVGGGYRQALRALAFFDAVRCHR